MSPTDDPIEKPPKNTNRSSSKKEIIETEKHLGRSRVLTGTGANKAAFLKACSGERLNIVHFAGHAFYDPRDPMASALVFTDTRKAIPQKESGPNM